ncbi:MAG TPA: RlmE family RNA methyltransferase [Desulfohalobiaceae bacterium]|nr:RlmE family RNA methyltransferase [Desulfohalobiaceae bacterium]
MCAYKKDHYFQKAKREDYPARSVYKLQEIEKRHKLFKPGIKVLDLGASPGSWALYAAKKIGKSGLVVALDKTEPSIAFPKQVVFVQSDIMGVDDQFVSILDNKGPFDLIMSDMAPQTTGIKIRDQALSYELADQAFQICQNYLIQRGHFVVKIFEGPDVPYFRNLLQQDFVKVKTVKPKSSRSGSKEVFLVGLDFSSAKSE